MTPVLRYDPSLPLRYDVRMLRTGERRARSSSIRVIEAG